MQCKIADLIVDVPAAGDMISRCKSYVYSTDNNSAADIVIKKEKINYDNWPGLSEEVAVYMETGYLFYSLLVKHGGMMLHSSAVEMEGKAYLFSGPCGIGKSTHTKLWEKTYREKACVFNDDKPALRKLDEKWFSYGTPWCGKNGINLNKKVPLAGICFLKQGDYNSIRRLDNKEAIPLILSQTNFRFKYAHNLDVLLNLIDQIVREIPIYELTNNATPESAILSYEIMRKGAEEAIL